MTDAGDVVRAFWDAVQARDWVGVAALLAPDVVLDWPVSRERIVTAGNVVAVNAEYPEGWTIRVIRIVGAGEQAASEVEVTMPDSPVSRSAAFWTVTDGRIVAGVEYWSEIDADPSPAWRALYTHELDASGRPVPSSTPGHVPRPPGQHGQVG